MKHTIKINGKKIRAIELGFPTLVAFLHRGTQFSRTQQQKYTEFCVQPLHNYLMAAIYHWWDMHSFHLYRHLEKPLMRRYYRKHNKRDNLLYTPLVARQDMRCFELTNKHRTVLHTEYDEPEEK